MGPAKSFAVASKNEQGQEEMAVSLAMIVKDEEDVLERCLQSVCDYVDEIVIVDTGSRDHTKDIARRYTSRIYDLPWRKDFAAARQHAFNQAKGNWVMWLDADDVLLNGDKLNASILSSSKEVKAFYWKYIAGHDPYGNSTLECWRERCVRNDGSFHWVGKVHEILVASGSPTVAYHDDIAVLHLWDPNKKRNNPRRNIEILKEEYESTRDDPEPRLLSYLGLEYANLGEYDHAVEFLNQYVQVANCKDQKSKDQKYLTLLKIADLYRSQAKLEAALNAAFESLKIHPHWPNAYFSLAETYYYLEDWPKVVHWVELGRTLVVPQTRYAVNPMDWRYRWIIHYTHALVHLDRLPEALEWTEKALEICPQDAWHVANRRLLTEAVCTESAHADTHPC
jgi:glycosyltransferase involved in cell wall biosynthesis